MSILANKNEIPDSLHTMTMEKEHTTYSISFTNFCSGFPQNILFPERRIAMIT